MKNNIQMSDVVSGTGLIIYQVLYQYTEDYVLVSDASFYFSPKYGIRFARPTRIQRTQGDDRYNKLVREFLTYS